MDETDYAYYSVIYGLKRLVVVVKNYFDLLFRHLGERFLQIIYLRVRGLES